MLLHKSNINVAIANILPYSKSRYDLPRPKYKNLGSRETEKWARLILRGPPIELGLKLFFGESRPPVGRLDTQISLPLSISRFNLFLAIILWIIACIYSATLFTESYFLPQIPVYE